MQQRTIKDTISVTGVGLHCGQRISLTVKPAPVNSGIQFVRTDFDQPVQIKTDPYRIQQTVLCTGLVNEDGVTVHTIEHLFAALAGLGIDNIRIELDGPEVPVMDGSASPFIYLLSKAGIQQQQAPKKYIRILKTIRIEDEG